jgi:GTP-dependent phosphoenolpyruvate carboxykinase
MAKAKIILFFLITGLKPRCKIKKQYFLKYKAENIYVLPLVFGPANIFLSQHPFSLTVSNLSVSNLKILCLKIYKSNLKIL